MSLTEDIGRWCDICWNNRAGIIYFREDGTRLDLCDECDPRARMNVNPLVIGDHNPTMPDRATLIECAEGAYGLGNNFNIDWERFYEILEMEGYDMQDLGGKLDEKIRRIVRKAVREGEVS